MSADAVGLRVADLSEGELEVVVVMVGTVKGFGLWGMGTVYFYLEEVFWRSVDFFKGLLAGVGEGLHA